MKLSFLAPLYAEPGPFASVYVDTSRDETAQDPEAVIALRWRHLRDDLAAEGADQGSIDAAARAVGSDADVPGTHGQALFTTHGALALRGELPRPPMRDSASYGTVPDAMPLAVQHAPEIPYLAVRLGYAGPHTDHPAGTVEWSVTCDAEAGVWPLTRVEPGERRHQTFAAGTWHQDAEQFGRDLDAWARRTGADVVVLAGDAWVRGVLAGRLPESLRSRVVTVEDAGGAEGGPGRAMLEEQLDTALGGRMAARDEVLLESFLTQRAYAGAAVEGLAATLTALQRAQADALFLNDHPESELRLWTGPESTQLAMSEGELRSFGVTACRLERGDAALVRALVGTGADLVVVPERRLRLRDGVGVLLRYADRAAAA